MKKIILIAAAALVALAPLSAESRKDQRDARKEAAAAAKTLKRDGYKPLELGDIQTRLEKYFIKTYDGCEQVVGTAENCMSSNLAQVTALANAANKYAINAGGTVRGRMVSSTSTLSNAQVDNLVASFERLVEIEIKGELIPYILVVKEKRGAHSARAYCLVDIDSCLKAKMRAMQAALQEQALLEQYGSSISDWIGEGFKPAGE